MFKPIYDKHKVPQSDRARLTRYLNKPGNGIPVGLEGYFLDRKYRQFKRDVFQLLTRQFVARMGLEVSHA